MYLSVSYITGINSTNVHVLSLDTQYLTGFLESVSSQLDFNVKAQNVKNIDICNFGATADIISELVPSIGVYRNLTIEGSYALFRKRPYRIARINNELHLQD